MYMASADKHQVFEYDQQIIERIDPNSSEDGHNAHFSLAVCRSELWANANKCSP